MDGFVAAMRRVQDEQVRLFEADLVAMEAETHARMLSAAQFYDCFFRRAMALEAEPGATREFWRARVAAADMMPAERRFLTSLLDCDALTTAFVLRTFAECDARNELVNGQIGGVAYQLLKTLQHWAVL